MTPSDLIEKLNINGKLYIKTKITPKSGRHEISGIMADGTVKIRLKSAPEQGKANEELVELLSEFFDIPENRIDITKGHTSPLKTVEITK